MRIETCIYCLRRFRVEGARRKDRYCSTEHYHKARGDDAEARAIRRAVLTLDGAALRELRRRKT